MTKKLKLEIELGNDSMKTGSDLAAALVKVADRLAGSRLNNNPGQKILDENGNSVGSWEVVDT